MAILLQILTQLKLLIHIVIIIVKLTEVFIMLGWILKISFGTFLMKRNNSIQLLVLWLQD